MPVGGSSARFAAVGALLVSASIAPSASARPLALPRAVSPFFPSLDALCGALSGAADVASVRDDVRAYCVDHAAIPTLSLIHI